VKPLFALLAALAVSAQAQDYPTKPVRLIVPLAAGGIADNLARTLGQKIADATKRPVLVDNRPGAAMVIGTELAAKAPADGYTIFMGGAGSLTVLPLLRKDLPYDAAKDFAPVIDIVVFANLLVVHPSVPAKSLKELIAFAKANPGKLSFASQGIASSGHMVGEQFKQVACVDIVHVPYKGGGPALTAVMAGEAQLTFDTLGTSLQLIRDGKLRVLAIGAAARVPDLPDVPTPADAGLKNAESAIWFGIFMPAKTPIAILDKFHAAGQRVLTDPAMLASLKKLGVETMAMTPGEMDDLVKRETASNLEIIKAAGIHQ